jgi:hypothetical protein
MGLVTNLKMAPGLELTEKLGMAATLEMAMAFKITLVRA